MRLLIHGDESSNMYLVVSVPNDMETEMDTVIKPYIYEEIEKAQYSGLQPYYEGRSFGWLGAVIIAVGSVISAYVGSRGGKASGNNYGWEALISRLKAMGIRYSNEKFVYCHHCDGKTYRVWINSKGSVEIAERPAVGENPRFDCALLPFSVLEFMPPCLEKQPTIKDWQTMLKEYGIFIVAALLLFM